MKRFSQNDDSTVDGQNEGASTSKSRSTHINNCRLFSEEYKVLIGFTSKNFPHDVLINYATKYFKHR